MLADRQEQEIKLEIGIKFYREKGTTCLPADHQQ